MRRTLTWLMGYLQSKLTVDLCVNVLVRPRTRISAAPVRGRTEAI